MPRLNWDVNRNFETGIDRGIFFPKSGMGEPWNGLISVEENPSDLKDHIHYRDGVKFTNRRMSDSFTASIRAYTYPDDLTSRSEFAFSYRVNTAEGYKTHIVYNAMAMMTQRSYAQSDTTPFSFDISTRPMPISGAAPSAHLIVDTNKAYSWTVTVFEEMLYGSDSSSSRLPSPQEVFEIFEINSILRIIDNGDGTWTATGPDAVIQMVSATQFEIAWPSAVMIDDISYIISSL